jgi:hypothetical protein
MAQEYWGKCVTQEMRSVLEGDLLEFCLLTTKGTLVVPVMLRLNPRRRIWVGRLCGLTFIPRRFCQGR